MSDTLRIWEKIPLGLLMAAQALVVFRWYAGEGLPGTVLAAMPWITTVFAVAAAVALDLVVVTTTMGRREGRESIYGMLTAASAAMFSALVALDVYGVFPFGAWLHAAFPITTFVYAQHLAVRVGTTTPDTIVAGDQHQEGSEITTILAAIEKKLSLVLDTNASLTIAEKSKTTCPHCGTDLGSIGAKGAAVKNGYCRYCKPSTNSPAADPIETMEVIA